MPLTDIQIKKVKPANKDQWLTDEKGLRLLIKPNGSRYWRMKYRFAGKQKTLALGVYPDVSLKMARLEREKARTMISEGVDPNEVKKQEKRKYIMGDHNTFSVLAQQWWEHQRATWSKDHAHRVWKRLKDNSFDLMDAKPIDQIRPKDIVETISLIEKRNALDVAKRVLQDIRRVFSYGVRLDWLPMNPATDLTGIVKTRKVKHRASMKNEELGQFLCELENYGNRGKNLTQYALKLLIYTFTRPGEVRLARWEEFDFAKSIWHIPGERMKMGTDHIIPLSKQVLSILLQIQEVSGQYELLFPSETDRFKAISDNTMRRAMRRMGYNGKVEGKSKATPHGFRANASSILNENGFNPDAVERQLSHQERNGVRAAYTHHAQYMDDRVIMMQWWADYLDHEAKSSSL